MSDLVTPRGCFEQTEWAMVRDQIASLNPHLIPHIDAWSPDPEFAIYKFHYPFGSQI